MATLHDILSARLENVRPASGGNGWTSACPACRAQGHDSGRDHLRIYQHGAFVCAKYKGESEHNRAIRAFLYLGTDPSALASLVATTLEDPNPKLDVDMVYPEEMLLKLVPDHRYWIGRGIDESVLRRLEGGLVPSDPPSKLAGRYCFPIRDPNTRRIMGWTGRLVSEASFGPKWKHLVRVSRSIYPLTANLDAIKRARKVVLVESVGNGLALSSAGIDYWLVLLGLHINSRLLGFLISANLDEVIASTDNDAIGRPESEEAGNRAAEKILAKLTPYLGEHKVRARLVQTRKDWAKAWEDKTGELEAFRAELEGGVTPAAPPPAEPFTL